MNIPLRLVGIVPIAVVERANSQAERAVESIDIEPVSVKAMEKIKRAIADAFTLGYAAALDDQRPARALRDNPKKRR